MWTKTDSAKYIRTIDKGQLKEEENDKNRRTIEITVHKAIRAYQIGRILLQ